MAKESIQVIDGDQKVPFLRGMITNSLMARGLTFQDAYRIADEVRERLRERGEIEKAQLSNLIHALVTERFPGKYAAPIKAPKPLPPIHVVDSDYEIPFSKGILSLSLQAAGLEPMAGFDVSRDIEKQLLKSGTRQIRREELRRMVYEAIVRSGEKRQAKYFLLWRLLREAQKPVIIIFGGATGTGKSSIASEVAHRLEFRQVLSTDSVREIMRLMFSEELMPVIHTSSFKAFEKFEKSFADEERAVLEAFKQQAIHVLVGVRAVMKRAIQENTHLILEGVHLVPGLMQIDDLKDHAHIVPVVVSTLNQKAHLQRFPTRESSSPRSAARYRQYFSQIQLIQDDILEMADGEDTPIVENLVIEETVPEVLSVISNTLFESLGLSREELLARVLP